MPGFAIQALIILGIPIAVLGGSCFLNDDAKKFRKYKKELKEKSKEEILELAEQYTKQLNNALNIISTSQEKIEANNLEILSKERCYNSLHQTKQSVVDKLSDEIINNEFEKLGITLDEAMGYQRVIKRPIVSD